METFQEYLEDPAKYELLRQFADEQMITESFDFLHNLWHLKADFKKNCEALWNQFVAPSSETAINIPYETVLKVRAQLDELSLAPTVFDCAQYEIWRLVVPFAMPFKIWIDEKAAKTVAEKQNPQAPMMSPKKSPSIKIKPDKHSEKQLDKTKKESHFRASGKLKIRGTVDKFRDHETNKEKKDSNIDTDVMRAGKKRIHETFSLTVHEVQLTEQPATYSPYLVLYNGSEPIGHSAIEHKTAPPTLFGWSQDIPVEGLDVLTIHINDYESGTLGYAILPVPLHDSKPHFSTLNVLKNIGRDLVLVGQITRENGPFYSVQALSLEGSNIKKDAYTVVIFVGVKTNRYPLGATEPPKFVIDSEEHGTLVIQIQETATESFVGEFSFALTDVPALVGPQKWILSGGSIGSLNVSYQITPFYVEDDLAYDELFRCLIQDNLKLLVAFTKNQQPNSKAHFASILQTNARKPFREFLAKRLCSENLDGYLATNNYQKIHSLERRQKEALRLYDTFVKPGGALEIGTLPSGIRTQIQKDLTKGDRDLFAPVKGHTFLAMWNLWLSFTESPDYYPSTLAPKGAYVNDNTTQLAMKLVSVFDVHRCASTLVKVLMEEELDICDIPTKLWTHDNFQADVLFHYLHTILGSLLAPAVQQSVQKLMAVKGTETENTISKMMISVCKSLSSKLLESLPQIPTVVRHVMGHYRMLVEKKWPDKTVSLNTVGLTILRYVGLLLSRPTKYGLYPEYPLPRQMELLLTTSKLLESLASDKHSSHFISSYLDKHLTSWLSKTKPCFVDFVDSLCQLNMKSDETPKQVQTDSYGKNMDALLLLIKEKEGFAFQVQDWKLNGLIDSLESKRNLSHPPAQKKVRPVGIAHVPGLRKS